MRSSGAITNKNWVPQTEKKTRAQKMLRAQCKESVQRSWHRLPKALLYFFLLISALFLLATLYRWLEGRRISVFTVEAVKIEGDLTEQQALKIEALLTPYLKGDFFRVDLVRTRSAIVDLSWVRDVEIQRQWPNTVWVNIITQKPVALWNDGRYINDSAEVYFMDRTVNNDEIAGLPKLYGVDGTHAQVMESYERFVSIVNGLDIKIDSLTYDERGSWKIIFSNKIELVLGFDDVMMRLQRFVDVYTKHFFEKRALIQSVDLRYSNGMAVFWKAKHQVDVDVITRS